MSPSGGVLTAVPGLPGAAARAFLRAGDAAVRASAAASDDTPPLTTPRDPAREAARRELSKSMYHEDDPSWFQRALDAFWAWVEDLFDSASAVTPGGPLGLVVVILVVLAVVGLLWWRLGTPRREPISSAALFDDRPRSAADHRSAAEAHAAQGHWNRAVQERMRAIVRALEERALLDVRPGRTADEAAADAGRSLPAHTDRLRAAARAFDDVTYGGRAANRQTYENLAALDRDLETTKPQLAAQAPGTAPQDRQGAAG
ncbi:DUF4129 domain-containing protein [Streptomyces sp. NPDC046859]|uniref:DUF4129 domain-containing protein n=1 Tax=Streptomyces sp. NPDC046859 TaxID=3155734 RepID=UPI0033CBDEE3